MTLGILFRTTTKLSGFIMKDLLFAASELGIAYHAKPKVKATAEQNLSTVGLDGILYFLGLKDSQIDQ